MEIGPSIIVGLQATNLHSRIQRCLSKKERTEQEIELEVSMVQGDVKEKHSTKRIATDWLMEKVPVEECVI